MKKKVAIVTGGARFIGSHMVDRLIRSDYKVRIIDNFSGGHEKNILQHKKNINVQLEEKNILNIRENNAIFNDVDYLFHFAGKGDIVPSIDNPKNYIQTNVLGTVNMLEGARNNNNIKFIYAASSSCYGLAKTPTKETNKICSYALLPARTLRCLGPFGPLRRVGPYLSKLEQEKEGY